MADDLNNSGMPDGWHPDGIMAGVPDMNAAAGQSTLPAVMSPAQIVDVAGDAASGDSASPPLGQQVAAAYDGVCRLPDGSLHPYADAGGGYGVIYGGGNANTNGQAGIGAAANSTAMPTEPKPGGVGGGGKSGPVTSPASAAARDLTGRAKLQGLEPVTGTTSVGGSLARSIPILTLPSMLYDFYEHDTAPVCTPITDPNAIY